MTTASLEVREPGPQAEQLLDSLRRRVADFLIDIADHGGGLHIASDLAGRVEGDFCSFLAIQLDDCGREAGVDWGRCISLGQRK